MQVISGWKKCKLELLVDRCIQEIPTVKLDNISYLLTIYYPLEVDLNRGY